MDDKYLKVNLKELLEAGKRIEVNWDCGGDESFVYTQIDGEEQDSEVSDSLEMHLIDRLQLPSAGEFSLKGKGIFSLEADQIILTYTSTLLGYEGKDGWEEVNQEEPEFSGRKVIFK